MKPLVRELVAILVISFATYVALVEHHTLLAIFLQVGVCWKSLTCIGLIKEMHDLNDEVEMCHIGVVSIANATVGIAAALFAGDAVLATRGLSIAGLNGITPSLCISTTTYLLWALVWIVYQHRLSRP